MIEGGYTPAETSEPHRNVKRTCTQRTFAAMTALVFLLLGAGDLFGLRVCPHHNAGAGHGEAHGAAEHHLHADAEHAAPMPEADHEPCNCAGFCPTAAGPSDPVSSGFSLPAAETSTTAPVEDDTGVVLVPVAHLLPYAQAPPIASE